MELVPAWEVEEMLGLFTAWDVVMLGLFTAWEVVEVSGLFTAWEVVYKLWLVTALVVENLLEVEGFRSTQK